MTPIPVTVLTGYLGAGKTTLLNRILQEDHGRRYAVIVNEFGQEGIDGELLAGTGEELFEMNNGCVCCTVRGDLIRTVHELLARSDGGGRPFDAIVVETTGLADPGPVVQTFLIDPVLQSRTVVDSVTTVVDALHIGRRLDDSREAVEQLAHADQIVLNKTDLADDAALAAVEARLRRINPWAPIHRARRADVPLDQVIGRGGFDPARLALPEETHGGCCDDDPHRHHEHHHDHSHDHHHHDHGIGSVSLVLDEPLDGAALTAWLGDLAATQGPDILRMKGILDVQGEPERWVVQGVHMLLECLPQRPWRDGEPRRSRLVFIGRKLDRAALLRAFGACRAA